MPKTGYFRGEMEMIDTVMGRHLENFQHNYIIESKQLVFPPAFDMMDDNQSETEVFVAEN